MPDTNDTTTTDVKKPSWNTSPNTLPGFVLDVQKYLPKRDARYKALVEYGYILERRSIICVSDNHIDRARQQLIPKGTFAAPTVVLPSAYDTTGLTVMTAEERKEYEALSDRKSYEINPALIQEMHTRMLNDILLCIEDDETCDELTEEADGSGPALLALRGGGGGGAFGGRWNRRF